MALQPPPIKTPPILANGHFDRTWIDWFISTQAMVQAGGAPTNAHYLVTSSNATLTNAFNLGTLTTGYLKITVAGAVATPSTSASIPASDLTGTTLPGSIINSSLQTLGALTALTINSATVTLSQDTNFVLSGGVNGISFDGTTLTVDATNDRVGVGTAGPLGTFDVANMVILTSGGSIFTNGSIIEYFFNGQALFGNNNSGGSSLKMFGGAGAGSFLDLVSTIGVGTTDFIKFRVGNDGAVEAMRILTDGKVGIATPTPGFALDVGGTANATAYRVGGTAGVSFGPSAVLSLTVVNGIVTAAA